MDTRKKDIGKGFKQPKVIKQQTRVAYSVPETAEMLGVSQLTVRKAIHAGTLQVFTIGGRYRVSTKELDRLMSTPIQRVKKVPRTEQES